jgi:DNA-binding transcriptional LysR family regulator
MALAFLLHNGGATYLPQRMVRDYLHTKRLYRVDDAPVIDRQVYVVYLHANERKELLEQVLGFLDGYATPETESAAAAMPVA